MTPHHTPEASGPRRHAGGEPDDDTAPPASTPVRPTNRPQYGKAHQRTSRDLIAEHVAAYGWMCSGDGEYHQVHPVPVGDLVADHVVAGQPEHGFRAVCRACNSARRNHGLG